VTATGPLNGFIQAPASDSLRLMKSQHPAVTTEEFGSSTQDETLDTPPTGEIVRRSTVRVLRGILKKPRRFSKDAKILDSEETTGPLDESISTPKSAPEGVIAEISNMHSSDDEQNKPKDGMNQTSPISGGAGLNSPPYKIQRGSLQMAPFDRMIFAKRGAELRDEYMRDFR